MKYSYLTVIVAFLASCMIGYLLIGKAEGLKAQNRLMNFTVNLSDLDTDSDQSITDDEIEIFFTEMFKNRGDGSLEPWSYEAVVSPIEVRNKRKFVEETFSKIDTNIDNKITVEEYIAYNSIGAKAAVTSLKGMKINVGKPSEPKPLNPIQFKPVPLKHDTE